MNGIVMGRPKVALRNLMPRLFDGAGAVLATTLVSGVMSAVCSYVVFTEVWDARAAVAASVATSQEEIAATDIVYLYPEGTASGLILAPARDPALPERPALAGIPETAGFHMMNWPSGPGDRPAASDAARPDIRLAALEPTPRPEWFAERTPADPFAGATALAPASSLLPQGRPDGFERIVAAALRPAPDAEIAVARAADPEEEITLARLDDATDSTAPFTIAPGTRVARNPCTARRLTADIPARGRRASSGSAVLAAVGDAAGSGRDSALVAEALEGNIPPHLRDLQPVVFNGIAGGRQTQVVLCVMPDYLAIGSAEDHVRVPLGLPAALRVADAFDMMLPTTAMVDQIYAQADLRLSPRPMPPGAAMVTTDYFARHDATLDAQITAAGGRAGLLLAGHKKDVVLANRLARATGRVAIYGWHRSPGDPIQSLSTVHGQYYADYSHGIRLISRTAFVDGEAVNLRDLLTSGTYAGLLNRDGVLNPATIRLASL